MKEYGEAIRVNANYGDAYVNRGILRRGRGDNAGALEDFEKAVQAAPRLPEAYLNRGWMRQAAGDLPGAVADYEKALELAPKGWRHRRLVEEKLKSARQK